MKNKKLWNAFLILAPIFAVGIAMMNTSVMVFTVGGGSLEAYSYFDLIPQVSVQILPPLAGTLCCIAEGLAVGYAVSRKESWLKSLLWVAGLAVLAATVPTVLSGDPKVVPNVGLPILMALEGAAAFFLKKQGAKKETVAAGPRLERH